MNEETGKETTRQVFQVLLKRYMLSFRTTAPTDYQGGGFFISTRGTRETAGGRKAVVPDRDYQFMKGA